MSGAIVKIKSSHQSSSTILAIDTATELCSAALYKDGEIFSRERFDPQGHSKLILQMIEEIFEESSTSRSELDAVSYDAGPGSFTGIRIGAGVAQGLSLGLEIPLLGISSLMILAESIGDQHSIGAPILAAIDARMEQIYWGILERDTRETMGWLWRHEPTVSEPALAQKVASGFVGIGSGWDRYADTLSDYGVSDWVPKVFPSAPRQVLLAQRLLHSEGGTDWQMALPTYVRDKVTS